jgi:hypothetical protein
MILLYYKNLYNIIKSTESIDNTNNKWFPSRLYISKYYDKYMNVELNYKEDDK